MNIDGANFTGYTASKTGNQFFTASDPSGQTTLEDKFFVATENEINQAVEKATKAFHEFKNFSGRKKAKFLDAIAEEILELGDTLIERTMAESGLPSARLQGERGRTVNQIGLFSNLLKEGSWVDARIDTALPDRTPPKPDIRYMNFALGPVVVFGASNFPFAFSTAGGDTISALAAGCPVIVKGHESHPGTNELVARAILKAAKKTGMPDGVFSSLNGGPSTGKSLVIHPNVKAIGFTGSLNAGKSIYDQVQKRSVPIPVYAEMGSTNPVFIFQETIENSSEELSTQLSQSVTLGSGQFCTAPGIIIATESEALTSFTEKLAKKLSDIQPGCMLNTGISENYKKTRSAILEQKGVKLLAEPSSENGALGKAAFATVSSSEFLKNSKLHQEVFGPFTLLISCKNKEEMYDVARNLEGQLTVTLFGTDSDLTNHASLVSVLREKAGRIIFNSVPTGVEVCPSMQHGGPFPATTDSKFTSVGTAAIKRFVRPIAFQNCPESLLPDELKDDNRLGIYRIYNGELTK